MSSTRPRALFSDIDCTLRPGMFESSYRSSSDRMLRTLTDDITQQRIARPRRILLFADITGRTLADHQQLCNRDKVFDNAVRAMDATIGSVGAEIAIRDQHRQFIPDTSWPRVTAWNRLEIIRQLVKHIPPREIRLQEPVAQSPHKISFYVTAPEVSDTAYTEKINAILTSKSVASHTIISGDMQRRYLDILPVDDTGVEVDKGSALAYTLGCLAAKNRTAVEDIFPAVAADGKNDYAALEMARNMGGGCIIVGNASDEVKEWAADTIPASQLYIAEPSITHATAVYYGARHFEILP